MKTDQEYLDDWMVKHREYTKLGYEIRNSKMADYCEEIILAAKEPYYNSGDPIMSDNAFDRFENYLKSLRPNSKLLEKVGT